jgi:low affinity Fe/Cu permease
MKNNSDSFKPSKFNKFFDKIASKITRVVGSPFSAIMALLVIVVWLISGPFFCFSDTWQLVINTGTTIITFIMVFIIQQSQNKDTTAIHLKLNELIATEKKASNRLIAVEDLTEEELIVLKKFYSRLAKLSKEEKNLHSSHSLDEAHEVHKEKVEHLKKK